MAEHSSGGGTHLLLCAKLCMMTAVSAPLSVSHMVPPLCPIAVQWSNSNQVDQARCGLVDTFRPAAAAMAAAVVVAAAQ